MGGEENLDAKSSFVKSHRGRNTPPRVNVTNVTKSYVTNITYEACVMKIVEREENCEYENVK